MAKQTSVKRPAKRRRRTYADRMSYQPRGSSSGSRGKRVVVGLLLLIVAGGLAYAALLSPLLAVKGVKVAGAEGIPAAEVSAAVSEAAEVRLGPLVSQSVLLADPPSIEAALKRKYPDLAEVKVAKRLPNGLTVTLTERQTSLVWKSGEQLYSVDQQGIAYATSEPKADALTIEDATGLPVEVGKPLVGAGFIKVVEEIKRDMDAAGLGVKTIRIPETTFEIQAVTNQGYYALYDTTRPVKSQTEALKQAITQQKPREYADLRVPGRVYVR